MNLQLLTRRRAIQALAGLVLAGVTGCGAVGPAVQIIVKLPWDKIISIAVNLLTGYVTIKGLLDGKEVQAQEKLKDEQLNEIKVGARVTVELNGGKEETVKPNVEK